MTMAGFAASEMRFPAGLPMGGYVRRMGLARGAHDELLACAAAFERSGRVIALVALDLVAVTADLAERIRAELAADGVAEDDLLIAATHTHSAPGGDHGELVAGRPYYPPSVADEIVRAAADATRRALGRRTETRLEWAEGEVTGVAANRFFAEPQAPPIAGLLIARDGAGRPIGALVSFGVHPTVLDESNLLYSSDLVGPLRRALGDALGGTPVVYLQGASGDLSTRGTRSAATLEEAERLGRRAGDELVALIDRARPIVVGRVGAGTVSLAVKARDFPSLEQSRAQVARLAARYERSQAGGVTASERRSAENDLVGAVEVVRMADELRSAHGELPVQALVLGDIAVVGIGAELFSELGATLRARAPGRGVLLATCANAYLGYVLSDAAVGSQRYEALVSWVAPDTGRRIVDAASRLVAEARRG